MTKTYGGLAVDGVDVAGLLPKKNGQVTLTDMPTDQIGRYVIQGANPADVPTATWKNRWEVLYQPYLGTPQLVVYLNEYGEWRVFSANINTTAVRWYLQHSPAETTRTANFWEVCDNPTDRNVINHIAPNGYMYGPTLGVEPHTFSVTGALTVQTGKSRIYLEGKYTVETVRASVNTAPTGAAVVVDVNKNGSTIFTTQANRPSIAATTNTATGTPDDAAKTFIAGDYLTVDVDQVGSGTAGSDLTVTVRLRRIP